MPASSSLLRRTLVKLIRIQTNELTLPPSTVKFLPPNTVTLSWGLGLEHIHSGKIQFGGRYSVFWGYSFPGGIKTENWINVIRKQLN